MAAAGDKIKFSERRDIFKDLLRFLKTETQPVNGMLKSQLKILYTNQYMTYRKQIDPNSCDRMPEFENLLSVGKNSKLITTSRLNVFIPKIPAYAQSDKKRVSAERGQSSSSPGPSRGTTPQRDPKPVPRSITKRSRRRIAVDQHLTFLQKLAPLTKDDCEKEDVTKFQFIGQVGNRFICSLCSSNLTSKMDTINHVKGKKHRLAYCVRMLKDHQEELLTGKLNVTITSSSPYEKGAYMLAAEERKQQLTDMTIKNNGDGPVELVHCEMMKRLRVFKLMDQKRVTDGTGGTAVIKPGQSYKIQVRMEARHVGSYHCPVMFHFVVTRPEGNSAFLMVRYLHGRCTDQITEELKAKTKYKRPPQVAKMTDESVEIEAGEKPASNLEDNLERTIQLKPNRVPEKVRKMINRGLKDDSSKLTEKEQSEMSKLRSIMESPVCMRDYQTRFKGLLFFEEVQMEVDIRKYDMEDVTMKVYPANKKLLVLSVPGLAEKRPSVLVGDWLYVRVFEGDNKLSKREYQGYVHEVLQNEVALGFSQGSKFVPNQKYRVRFMFNRLSMSLQHRACEMAKELSLDKMLFPDNELPSQYHLPQLTFYNRDIEGNQQQKCAVQHIIIGTSIPAPYIIFGPPGTGKTVTVVEAIKQVWKLGGDSHILACTPSNSACDLITARLLKHIPKSSILRLNAKSRQYSTIPEEIKPVCNYKPTSRQFYIPDKKKLSDYRIIVCTLITAGRLVSANFASGHFSHVFIDEAGHAVEPEALIPVAGVMEVNSALKTGGQVVLAGDPKQLGPVLRSPLAIKYGFSISLLERYMETCDLYIPKTVGTDHKQYDVRVITKLLQNYRSHPAILKLPNEMFYDSELQPCASIDREKLCHWEGLPQKGFPVLFHGVIGEDMREERSPSFFNPEEVSLVVKYVEELLTCRKGGINLKQEDIGVVTPYSKQVKKISAMLKKRKYERITVGSVEQFQGAERTVIIVSTVRSKPDYMSLDLHFKLGFLRNPKRFNVTVTRAKALLVIIGNPETLSHDPYWKSFIEYCEKAKSYKGVSIGEERMTEEDHIEDLCQRLETMQIIDRNMEFTPMIQTELSEQPWRNEL